MRGLHRVTIPGTKPVVLRGGPVEWDGRISSVVKTERRTLERWDHKRGGPVLYETTGELEDVEITEKLRSGDRTKVVSAEVYRYAGHRPTPN